MKRPRSGNANASHDTKTKHHAVASEVEVVTCAASFPIASQTKRTKYDHNNTNTNHHQYHQNDNPNDNDTTRNMAKNNKNTKNTSKVYDWNETVREVQRFGAQGWGAATVRSRTNKGFAATSNHDDNDDKNVTENIISNTIIERKKFRRHQEEQYELLTGRKKKHHAVPLPIVRGIKKKAIAREARILQEAKDAGIVLPIQSIAMTQPSAKQREQMKKQQNFKMNQQYGPAPSIGFMKQGMYQVRGTNGSGGGTNSSRGSKNNSSRKKK
jgi:hypothetical protein